MKRVGFLTFCVFLFLLGLLGNDRSSASSEEQKSANARESAYRANNIGVALLEQFKYKEGAEQFRSALAIEPKLALAHINLSIALYNLPELQESQKEAEAAISLSPDSPQPYYIIGLIAKSQSRSEAAIGPFQKVLKIDGNDVGANVNLGQIYSQQKKYPEAIALFRTALAAEPYNTTALYNLGTALIRAGQREEGQRVIQRFQEFRQRGSGTSLGNTYLEQGRYADAIASTGMESELVQRTPPPITFSDSTSSFFSSPTQGSYSRPVIGGRMRSAEMNELKRRSIANGLGGSATLFDYDGDGALDLLWINDVEQHLYHNDNGKFREVTNSSGALAVKGNAINVAAVSGDYDNDGKPDLFIVRDGALALYHNDGDGKFSDVSKGAGIPSYPYLPGAVAFVDYDHDGDLDIVVGGLADLSKPPKTDEPVFPLDFVAAPNLLLRNDGTGKFSDVTTESKISPTGHVTAIVPTDFNNRRDIDLLLVDYGVAPQLFSNQRDGSFRNVSADVGLNVAGPWTCVAAGDFNKDGFTDFFFGSAEGDGTFAISDGREKFKTVAAPHSSAQARAAQFLDYDEDGLLDCVVLTKSGLNVLRNIGSGWSEVSVGATANSLSEYPRLLMSGDIDGDGDTDFVLTNSEGQLRVFRNDGGNANHALRVNLNGKVSNRSAVGAKIETRAGSLAQKLESYSAYPAPAPADLLFGLGTRDQVDTVRILWPAGIVQSETEIARVTNKPLVTLAVTEVDRKPSSCPFLYAWNGQRFEFITDFMGGGEMGYLEEPGRHNTPDPVEYVRLTSDQLKERNGKYELKVTNELEETLFADEFKLLVLDHPADVEVYPNEGMSDPPKPFIIYKTYQAAPPLTAMDDHGTDVLDRVSRMDRRYPDAFRLDRIRGYADEHTLTMKLKPDVTAKDTPDRVLLLLTGWTDYAWSSDNVAASQARKEMSPPALQVKDRDGNWKTVIPDIGIPVGRPQTVTVDLTGKFLSENREVRIVTSMRIYWDQVLVDTSSGNFQTRMSTLEPISSDLRWRGFSREISPDGREPYGYDYSKVSFTSPWKVMTGRYTREGDVLPLLLRADDMFVIAKPGDEISLTFDASKSRPLPLGWKRTFFLYSDGFSKEMDINSASPDQVAPLPFHGMSRYPYPSSESYPLTLERREYLDRYNTRVVSSSVPALDAILAIEPSRR